MAVAGSPSIETPDYWWYRVRSDMLQQALERYVGDPGLVLDVGSADGPSVNWLRGRGQRVALDIDPRGLEPGDVCASLLDLPFADQLFDVVSAFDVIEHCDPEARALDEVFRVLRPGGRFLMAVPAYEWAWTYHDDFNHHHRRYTVARAEAAVRSAGFTVLRSTYGFAGTFPLFTIDRLRNRIKQRGRPAPELAPDEVPPLPEVSQLQEKVLLGLSQVDLRLIRNHRLPFGSSVVVAAQRPATPEMTPRGQPER